MDSREATLDSVELVVLEKGSQAATLFTLEAGNTWRMGRDTRCNHVLENPAVSSFSVIIHRNERGVVFVASQQRGAALLKVLTGQGREQHSLVFNSPAVRLGRDSVSSVRLEVPQLLAEIIVKIDSDIKPTISDVPTKTDATVTWTSSSPNRLKTPFWVEVVAIAIAIDSFPELRRGDGRDELKFSDALRLGVSLWVGRSSRSFVNDRLKEAAQNADIDSSAGGERLQSIVGYYSPHFSPEKIRRLRDRLAPLMAQMQSAISSEED